MSRKNSIAYTYDKNAPLEIYLPSCEKYLKQVVLPSYVVGIHTRNIYGGGFSLSTIKKSAK